jgi:tol-pal system protein YbgF
LKLKRHLSLISVVAVGLLALVALGGCISMDTGGGNRLDDLESRVLRLQGMVNQQRRTTEPLARFQANTSARLDAIETALNDLKGLKDTVARLQQQLGQPGAPVTPGQAGAAQVTLAQLAARVTAIEQRLHMARPGPQPPAGPPAAPPAPPTAGPRPTPTPPPTAAPASPEALFQQARTLYRQRRFAAALIKFRDFLGQNPKHALAASAQFGIGDCLFYQKRYEDAIVQYQRVVERFRRSPLVPTAMLQQAQAFLQMRDKMAARELLRRVISRYPRSQAARVARARLSAIR